MKLLSNFNGLPNIKIVCLLLQQYCNAEHDNAVNGSERNNVSMDQKEKNVSGCGWIHQADGRVMW
jgi:hypothetical protein